MDGSHILLDSEAPPWLVFGDWAISVHNEVLRSAVFMNEKLHLWLSFVCWPFSTVLFQVFWQECLTVWLEKRLTSDPERSSCSWIQWRVQGVCGPPCQHWWAIHSRQFRSRNKYMDISWEQCLQMTVHIFCEGKETILTSKEIVAPSVSKFIGTVVENNVSFRDIFILIGLCSFLHVCWTLYKSLLVQGFLSPFQLCFCALK